RPGTRVRQSVLRMRLRTRLVRFWPNNKLDGRTPWASSRVLLVWLPPPLARLPAESEIWIQQEAQPSVNKSETSFREWVMDNGRHYTTSTSSTADRCSGSDATGTASGSVGRRESQSPTRGAREHDSISRVGRRFIRDGCGYAWPRGRRRRSS